MHYLLYPGLLLSLAIFFLGIKWSIEVWNLKTIAQFPLDENLHEFIIEKPGLYSFTITGARWINNDGKFKTGLKAPIHAGELELIQPLAYSLSLKYLQFDVKTPGIYSLHCKNVADLSAKESMLFTKRLIQKNIHHSQLGIAIKQVLTKTQFFSIIFTILGFQASAVLIILILKHHNLIHFNT